MFDIDEYENNAKRNEKKLDLVKFVQIFFVKLSIDFVTYRFIQ